MEGKGNISKYRNKLDKTVASPDLTNTERLHTLVKNQILSTSEFGKQEFVEKVVERRTAEVANFLGMLRSASVNDVGSSITDQEACGAWKLKQDTEEFRVMYREGPEGTPFHTLLVEGYVDGPLDVCLCISCESGLYKKWWPQTTIPNFKIISSQCLQRVRVGEQISLVRMKVSWPLSSREALIHYFTFEYFQEGLIVVLLNSISDSESIDRSTHGFTRDGIPDAHDVVRIDVVGGFALQKVTAERSFFRTIANMDIKLDFVPPAFINFISRQLIGSGFKLYKKEVSSVCKGDKDKDFGEALKGPLYQRIREALYSEKVSMPALHEEVNSGTDILLEEQPRTANGTGESDHSDESSEDYQFEDAAVKDGNTLGEIEEIEETDIRKDESLVKNDQKLYDHQGKENMGKRWVDKRKEVSISPEVQQALGTLEKVISFIRDHQFHAMMGSLPDESEKNLKKLAVGDVKASEGDQVVATNNDSAKLTKKESVETASIEPRSSSDSRGSRRRASNSYTRETNNKVAPASLDENHLLVETNHNFYANENQTNAISFEKVSEGNPLNADANVMNRVKPTIKSRKVRYCCFYSFLGK